MAVGHKAHAVDPPVENEPASQVVHAVPPAETPAVPAAQGVQTAAPEAE